MPDNIASVRCEERKKMRMTNDDSHCVDLNSTDVLADNRIELLSKRRDLLSLSLEASDRLEDHRVHKIDGGLY